MNTPTTNDRPTDPIDIRTADHSERVTALCTQIDTIVEAQGAPGRLPDYLVSPREEVRDAVAAHFAERDFDVSTGFEADNGAWMRIAPSGSE